MKYTRSHSNLHSIFNYWHWWRSNSIKEECAR